jgi:hypothetical protein
LGTKTTTLKQEGNVSSITSQNQYIFEYMKHPA